MSRTPHRLEGNSYIERGRMIGDGGDPDTRLQRLELTALEAFQEQDEVYDACSAAEDQILLDNVRGRGPDLPIEVFPAVSRFGRDTAVNLLRRIGAANIIAPSEREQNISRCA